MPQSHSVYKIVSGGLRKSVLPLLYLTGFQLMAFLMIDFTFPFRHEPEWSQVVLDKKDRALHYFISKDEKWRFKTSQEEVNPLMTQTLIIKEDRFFRWHPGFNPVSIMRALIQNLVSGKRKSGASTITMQVVRLLEPRPRNLASKLIECIRAMQLEWHLSKNEILDLYLSLAPYGGNIEGVKAASLIYLGKSPGLLSPAEAVLLTIIPNRPTTLRPGYRTDTLINERNRWLIAMHEEGLLSQEDLDVAIREPVSMSRRQLNSKAPHLAYRLRSLHHEPYIRTTLDADIQERVGQLCYNHITRLRQQGIDNGAVLVIDNRNSEVIAYAGSQDFFDAAHSGQVDGIRAIRSPGSTLKPLVYAMGFDRGLVTPKFMLPDVPVDFGGYRPENFDLKFYGMISMEDALSGSLNIPAVGLLEQIGVPGFREALMGAGFRSLQSQRDLGLSTILGGCGTTLEELCGLYSAIANEGSYIPIRYTPKGSEQRDSFPLMSRSASFIISEILSKMNRPDLPHLFENSLRAPKVAWKTGTSYGRRDGWSIGFNKRYTVGVWTGNFSGKGVADLTGADMATPLMFQVFNSLDESGKGNWFQPDGELDLRYVCPSSGLIPGQWCTSKIIDYYLPGVSATDACSHQTMVKVDSRENYSYCTACLPESGYKEHLYDNPLPEVLRYFLENGIPVRIPPPHLNTCSRVFEGEKPRITSLNNGQEYLMGKDEDKTLELSCATAADASSVSWFINDRFHQTSSCGDKAFFEPKNEGRYKVSCTDDRGRMCCINISVIFY